VVRDAVGRISPDGHERPFRSDRAVGVFYFLWLQGHEGQKVNDISRILARDPVHPEFGPETSFHWWGQPRLGYYASDDDFVIERHAQMLSDAGVDVIVCDVTNGLTYDETVLEIGRVYERLRALGRRTPQIAFIAHTKSVETVQHLFDSIYAKNLFQDLWFRWDGKPLLLSPSEGLSKEVLSYFTIRESWAWTDAKGWFGDGRDKWPWLDHTPQQPGWHDDQKNPEEISVAVAEHPISNIGRSFHDGKEPAEDQQHPEQGLYFAEQWERAFAVDPRFVLVTGWNEWIAQRFVRTKRSHSVFLGKPLPKGGTYFIDEYDQEYSRDIEPMQGGHGDDFYYQLVEAVRRYKGVHPARSAVPPRTIGIGEDFSAWDAVTESYVDDLGDAAERDHHGFDPATNYVNHSGRNDLSVMKVAHDQEFVYFYVRTHASLTQPEGDSWMLLFIDADGDKGNGWLGYELVVDRSIARTADGWTASVERSDGGWTWKPIGQCRMAFKDNQLQIAIPRALLKGAGNRLAIDFKWADNLPDTGDPAAFLDAGDVAPNGRFSYRYLGE
jgi:hypothetical protein